MTNTEPKNNVVFFLGAGASVAAEVPTTVRFVSKFKEWLSKQNSPEEERAFINLLAILERNGRQVDIELLMESLDSLTGSLGALQDLFEYSPKITEVKHEHFGRLKATLKSFIQTETLVGPDKIGYLESILGFMDAGALDVFSVNYDTCIEQLCHVHRKKYTDGFEFEWWPQAFDREDLELKLYKIHGSVLWYETQESKYLKIPVPPRGPIEVFSGGLAEPLMLYPMRKWQYAEPLLELMILLKRRLEDIQNTKYVVVVGYSFRDEYIKKLFWDAFRNNKDLVMVLVDPLAIKIYEKELKYYRTPLGYDALDDGVKSPMFNRVVCLPFGFEKVLPRLKNKYMIPLQEGRNKYFLAINAERSEGNANWQAPLLPLLLAGDYELFEEAYCKSVRNAWGVKDKVGILGTAIVVALARNSDVDTQKYLEELRKYTEPIFASAGCAPSDRIVNPRQIRLGIKFSINRTVCDPYEFGNAFSQIQQQTTHLICGNEHAKRVADYFGLISKHFFALGNAIELPQYPAIYPEKTIFHSRAAEYLENFSSPDVVGNATETDRRVQNLFEIEKGYLAKIIMDAAIV